MVCVLQVCIERVTYTMGRAPKDSVVLNMRIEKQLSERLDSFSEETCRTKTATVEMILREYFDKIDKAKNKKSK